VEEGFLAEGVLAGRVVAGGFGASEE